MIKKFVQVKTGRNFVYTPQGKRPGTLPKKNDQGLKARAIICHNRSTAMAYIDNQEEHHRTRTFQEEYRAFLTKYDVAYDERYVWD